MNITLLLLALSTVLVLRSGERIVVDGPVTERRQTLVFRSNGVLYSLPAHEIAAVERPGTPPPITKTEPLPEAPSSDEMRRLRLSDDERRRLIAELEKNHSGTDAAPLPVEQFIRPPRTMREEAAAKEEEWSWRRQARGYEEAIRQAREDLELLETQVQELEGKILSLLSLGYKPQQFSYDTTLLARKREQIPAARLTVVRAERAWDEFREDARRQGILPGWLR